MRSPRRTPEVRKGILATDTTLTPGEKKSLRRGSLYWVSDDMSLLAHKTSTDMPAWSPIMCKPTASGIIVLAETWSSANPARMSPEVIIAWVTHDDATMTVRVYSNFTGGYVLTNRVDIPADATLPMETREPEGATLLQKLASSVSEHHPSYAPNHAVLQVLGAAWILMQQDTIAKPRQERVLPPLGGGKKPKKPDLVQIISLRRVVQPPPRDDSPTEGGGRDYQVRWLVKGHWRQQRVGPGRKYRRPTYIAPHIKGPVGAPLKTDRVNVWRR